MVVGPENEAKKSHCEPVTDRFSCNGPLNDKIIQCGLTGFDVRFAFLSTLTIETSNVCMAAAISYFIFIESEFSLCNLEDQRSRLQQNMNWVPARYPILFINWISDMGLDDHVN